MKKTLILLAGYPGTGKSYMANIIIKNFPELRLLSPDDIKEKFWDKYGFDTLEQKEELIVRAWNTYYDEMEQLKTKTNIGKVDKTIWISGMYDSSYWTD